MKIRLANSEDFDALNDMAKKFYDHGNFSKMGWNYSEESFRKLVDAMIADPNLAVIFMAEEDGEPAASIGGFLSPWLLDLEQKQLTESWFWVHEEFRTSGIAKKLIKRFISYGKQVGVVNVHMISLNNDYQKALNRFYTGMGFSELETTFRLEV